MAVIHQLWPLSVKRDDGSDAAAKPTVMVVSQPYHRHCRFQLTQSTGHSSNHLRPRCRTYSIWCLLLLEEKEIY